MKIRSASASLLMMSVLFFSSLATGSFAEEAGSDHHEHPGLTDASPGSDHHKHGDSDDHHSKPNGGCHHHVIHCGCSHGQPMVASSVSGAEVQVTTGRISTPALLRQADLDPKNTFHIPIS